MIDRVRAIATAFAFLSFVTSAQAFDINDLAKGVTILDQLTGGASQNTTNKRAEPQRPVTPEAPRPSSAAIREIQALLAQLGYDPGPADGLMGRRTASAIRAFESDRGLAVTGVPDDRVLASLRDAAQYQTGYGTHAVSSQPSFDCQHASTPTEMAICGSHDLAELDRAVASNYAAALDARDAQGRAQLQAEQRNWMAERDHCGAEVMCLVLALGARSQALVVMANAQDSVPQIPILPMPTPDPETHNATTTGQATLPLFDFGDGENGSGGPIFLAYQGRTRVPFNWLPHDDVEQHRAALASIIFNQTSGTEHEEYFFKTRTLTLDEAFEALAIAGIERTPFLENYLATDAMRRFDGILDAVQYGGGVNQFQEERLKAALRDKARASLAAQSKGNSLDVTVICAIEVLPYDFTTGMFPFGKDDVEHCFAGRPNAIGTVAGRQASVGISGHLRPDGFAIGATEAEALVERIGGPHFVLAIPARITGRIEMQSSGQPLLAFTAEPTGAMEVRTGADLMEVLYRFPAEDLRDVNDTPEARRLTDFDRAWWINTPEEVVVISERAETASLATLAPENLFNEKTGLRLAVSANYGKAMTSEDRTLAGFLDQRPDRETQEIGAALGLPEGNLHVMWFNPSLNGGLERIVLVLPQSAQSYPVAGELPAYAPDGSGDYPGAHLEIAVTAEKRVRLSGGQERIVMAGHPETLEVRRTSTRLGYDASPEIASVAFSPIEAPGFETVRLAWRSDLLLSASELLDIELGELLRQQLESEASGFARNDAFARRDAAASLEREAKARADGKNKHWMQAQVRLAPYDFDRGGWPVQSFSLRPAPDAPPADQSLRIEYMRPRENGAYKEVFLPMDAGTAKAFQSDLPSFPNLDALVAFRISEVDTTYGTDFGPNISLVHEPVEIILFEIGKGGPVIDPGAVKFRHVFAPSAAEPATAPADAAPATAAGLPPGSFAVLDVRLGDDFDTSVGQLAQRIAPDQRLFARTDTRQAALEAGGRAGQITDWAPYHNAVLLESRGNNDMVAIYHEPPGDASTVTAIVRTKLFEPGTGPSWPALRDNLLKSYPEIDASDFEGLDNPFYVVIWDMPRHRTGDPVDIHAAACQRGVNAMAGHSRSNSNSFRRAREEGNLPVLSPYATWFDAEGVETRPFAPPLSMPEMFANSATCPPHEVMVLTMIYGDDGRVIEYRQGVTMPVQVAAIAERRKSAAAEAATVDFDL